MIEDLIFFGSALVTGIVLAVWDNRNSQKELQRSIDVKKEVMETLENAIDLCKDCDVTKQQVHQLVDEVFSKSE